MKKIISVLFLFISIIALGQQRTVFFDGKEYVVGSEEYKQACISYYIEKSKNTPTEIIIGGFKDNESFMEYQRGIKEIAIGTTFGLIGASTVGVGLICIGKTDNAGDVLTVVGGCVSLVGSIFAVMGIYKISKFSFNGGKFTYNF